MTQQTSTRDDLLLLGITLNGRAGKEERGSSSESMKIALIYNQASQPVPWSSLARLTMRHLGEKSYVIDYREKHSLRVIMRTQEMNIMGDEWDKDEWG